MKHIGVKVQASTFFSLLMVVAFIIVVAITAACSAVPLPIKNKKNEVALAKPVSLSNELTAKNNAIATDDSQQQLAKQVPLQAEVQAAPSVESAEVETVDAVEISLTPEKSKIAAAVVAAESQILLSPQERLLHGIELLKLGKVADAEKEFQQVLQQQGQNSTAQNMLRQIRLQPEQYFGDSMIKSQYRVESGDTFYSIATDYLGNSLEFHILAKLNSRRGITDLKVGESIVVPLPRGSVAAASTGDRSKKSTSKNIKNPEYMIAKKYYDQGQYKSSIAVLEANIQNNKKDYDSKDLLVMAYTKYAQFLEKQANLIEAQTVLVKAISMQPENKALQVQITRVNNQRKAEKAYQTGMKALSKGNEYEAYAAFENTLALAPNNEPARTQMTRLKSSVTKSLHDKAMTLYKNQDIKAAIGNWDRLLMIDPDHELARLYRGRAIELQKRLDKLPKNF
ncbi:MAG: tetratricopeptide repeat protein [Thiohalomonadales bacterium]